MSSKFTFITPFFQRHGIGFLDVILQALNNGGEDSKNQKVTRDQYELHLESRANGVLENLERVIYILPKNYQDNWGAVSLWKEFLSEAKLELIEKSITKTSQSLEQSIEDLQKLVSFIKNSETKAFPDYQWLKENWHNHDDLWHIINEFSLKTQVQWYKNSSYIYRNNKHAKFEFVELDITYKQLQEEYETARSLKNWLSKKNFNNNTYVNLWGISTSLQIGIHYLSWSSPRFKSTNFLKCTTSKAPKDNQRFTPLEITIVNKDLLAELESAGNKERGLSSLQVNNYQWLEQYKDFDDNFTIMLLGPRGTGKTEVVNKVYADKDKDNVISINCAQFQSNPELARSELFGHRKGAFTGANSDKQGAFELANDKVLFLDEIHHLDKATQSMLLTALQTEDGYFHFTPLGDTPSNKSKFQLIVASNLKHEDLNEAILPDLLDRISQRTLTFHALQPGISILKEFETVWGRMDFKRAPYPLGGDNNEEFKRWLTDPKKVFNGNYRDLQKISILCADYQRCASNSKLIPKGTSLVNYIEANSRQPQKTKEFDIERFFNEKSKLSLTEITNEFKAKIVRAAEYHCGDAKSAAAMLGITPKSIIDIKKRDKEQ